MATDDAAASLKAHLVTSLRQRIHAEEREAATELRAAFRVLAQDYRTFRLMDELPGHADGAHSAWRELVPEIPEAVSRLQLLEVLEAAYREAIADPKDPSDGQDGQ